MQVQKRKEFLDNFASNHAKIAQLVEHNLAKVRVRGFESRFSLQVARVVESVDTRDLKSRGHCGCAGSSPASSTSKHQGVSTKLAPFFIAYLKHKKHTFVQKKLYL